MNELNYGRRLIAADLLAGLAFLVIGIGALVAALSMPTFVDRGADPLTAPGIFPAFVSAVIMLLGAVLVLRSLRSRATSSEEQDAPLNLRPVAIGLVLMTVAILGIGKLPFGVVMAGFCIAYFAAFVTWRGSRVEIIRRLTAALVTTLIAATLIPLAFEHIFLVRLP